MDDVKRPVFIWVLLFCVVLVNGFMVAPGVSHPEHHEDHQATTHSTGICAWLCAAGQGIESASVGLSPQLQPIERTTAASVGPFLFQISFRSHFRGPPVSLS